MKETLLYGPVTVKGNCASKANGRRITFRRGKPRSIKSEKALNFVEACLAQLKRPKVPILGDLRLVCWIHYRDRKPDLDESLVKDSLEKAKVIKNDRQIKHHDTEWALDKSNPRVEIALTTWTPVKSFEEML